MFQIKNSVRDRNVNKK